MSQLLAVHDPSGKLGLTDPSPGGGSVPVRYSGRSCAYPEHHKWREYARTDCYMCRYPETALLLRTEDDNEDPLGMARAKEVLALSQPCFHSAEDVARGVWFFRDYIKEESSKGVTQTPVWTLQTPGERTSLWVVDPNESAPEALARLLSQHLGCEVIRG